MQKFPGQGLNPRHCSDNSGSLISRPPGNSKLNISTQYRYLVFREAHGFGVLTGTESTIKAKNQVATLASDPE